MADLPGSDWDESVLVMQLLTPESLALVDQWNPVAVPPERHLAYAIQWFGLASVLVIGFGIWGFQRGRPS
jgi:cytochrome oxidase assembly protein ShyY1